MTDDASVICTSWKPFQSGTLQGFADFELRRTRLKILGCAVHRKDGRQWVQLPAKPALDQNRELLRGDGGKIKYWPCMEFTDREAADQFSQAALRALEQYGFQKDFGGGRSV